MGVFDARALVEELQHTFASGKTRNLEWRKEQLAGLQRLTTEKEGEILEALKLDLNKPIKEGLREIAIVRGSAARTLAHLDEWVAPVKVTSEVPLYADSEIVPEPLGVVLNIAPWNYPFSLSMDPVVGAIAAGNAVVVKPSQMAPATADLLVKLIPLYMDSSAVRAVVGGLEVKKAILKERWDKIFFTGAPKIGRIIMEAAAKHLTPVVLELGGKCPAIVDSTTDCAVVAKRITLGKWSYNNGQTCLSPDYILAGESIVEDLVSKFKSTIKQIYGDDPTKSKEIARIVNKTQFTRLKDLLNDEKTISKVVLGGHHDEESLSFEPTLILNPPFDAPVMQEEVFGPLLAIVTVKNIHQAIQIVNSRPKPLALYLFTEDRKVINRVKAETSSGGITVNDILLHVFNTELPFGGVGESGMGQYHGRYTVDAFSHKKSVLYRHPSSELTSTIAPDRL